MWDARLPRYLPYVVRVDGRAFHTLLRDAEKPFDRRVSHHMGRVALALCQQIDGAVFAYQQSDEVSVLVCSYEDFRTEPWFGGRVNKIASISASVATGAFSRYALEPGVILRNLGLFDARVFVLPNAVEVANYFLWRQRDATRNSISAAAQAHFPHSTLQGLNGDQLQELLWRQKSVNWNDYPTAFKRGQVVAPDWATQDPWELRDAPVFNAAPDGWLADIIPPLPMFDGTASAEAVRLAVKEYFPPGVVRDIDRLKALREGTDD